MTTVRVGLIVNPFAGLGGAVALKGSDGVVDEALARGAVPQSGARAAESLTALQPLAGVLNVITGAGALGEEAAHAAGLATDVIYHAPMHSTAEDTVHLAQRLNTLRVDLLLFAGGDGTARDVADGVDDSLPVLGIPAGVKMHSGVFATTPRAAGLLALSFLRSKARRVARQEVMDLDEDAVRAGHVHPMLYGYLSVPEDPRLLQGRKVQAANGDAVAAEAIAASVIEEMEPGVVYLIGPGSTTAAVKQALGDRPVLLGVDAYVDGKLLLRDATAAQLEEIVAHRPARALITCIGGQGHIFGRGNQQFSGAVVRRLGRAGIRVLATPAKLQSLSGRPFIVDLRDQVAATEMSGYVEVVSGYRSRAYYRCEAM